MSWDFNTFAEFISTSVSREQTWTDTLIVVFVSLLTLIVARVVVIAKHEAAISYTVLVPPQLQKKSNGTDIRLDSEKDDEPEVPRRLDSVTGVPIRTDICIRFAMVGSILDAQQMATV